MSVSPTAMSPLEEEVLSSLGHPRYRCAFLPLWRIREDLRSPPTPAAVYRALRRLEGKGLAESRRSRSVVLWRLPPSVNTWGEAEEAVDKKPLGQGHRVRSEEDTR